MPRAPALRRGKAPSTSNVSDLDRAKEAAYRLLAYRSRSVAELAGRLKEKGFEEDTVEGVVERLKELRLLDDDDFARRFARELAEVKGYGRFVIAARLREKGVDGEVAEGALKSAFLNWSEFESARKLAEKKVKQQPLTQKERGRIGRFLQGRGYPFEIITDVLKGLDERDGN